MSGTVVPFRRPARTVSELPSLVVFARGREVLVELDDRELSFTPEQARELADALVDLADDAEANHG